MSPAITTLGETVWDLPPLILHPFNEKVAPSTLLESSKAALMLSGLIPTEGASDEFLESAPTPRSRRHIAPSWHPPIGPAHQLDETACRTNADRKSGV